MSTPAEGISFLSESRPPSAGIDWRDDGRQICIDTGVRYSTDEAEAEAQDLLDEMQTGPEPEQAKRGKVQHFSDASRRNLRRTVHALRRDARCLFVSLTYHETDPHPREAKEHLDRFWKALRYHHGALSAVWKMEPQKRGVVHFHLLIYGTTWIRAAFLSQLWHNCTGETSDAHYKSGVDTEWIDPKADGKVQAYLAKYMTKDVDLAEIGWEDPGRWWGVLSRADLPEAKWNGHADLDEAEARFLIRRLLQEWGMHSDEWFPPRLTINTRGAPEEVVDRLLGLLA